MQGNGYQVMERVKDFYTFYFIESHLKSLNSEISLILDSSGKHLSSLKKISEKDFKDTKNEEYILSVYSIEFKPTLIKQKEVKNENGIPTIKIKVALKMKKNKFESHNYVRIDHDSFCPKINFEMIKKLIGKDQYPPEQMELTNLQIVQIFSDALLIKERMKTNDITYMELMQYGVKLLQGMDSYELLLFLLLYINIVNSHHLKLIQKIFELFNLNKIIKPQDLSCLSPYEEKFEILYCEQNAFFDKVKKMGNVNFREYLIKFYTIYFNLYFTLGNFQQCENVMKDLRDNNPYDNLILARLYLSNYNEFYRSIPISNDMKNSLMGKFIHTSETYEELCKSFSLISEYINYNFPTLLLIIVDNFNKIHSICLKSNKSLKINNYISLNESDDLLQIQKNLDIITKYKLENNFITINFDIKMWDFYLSNLEKNKIFWEFLKANLIEGSLNYKELVDSFHYIENFTKRGFVEMLEMINNHYDKLRHLCVNEKKQIIMTEFITQTNRDDPEKIKGYYSFIVSRKLKDQYETILFKIDIWNYYIFNHFQLDFLTFLEKKLYEQAVNVKELLDCLTYSSHFRNRSFLSMLEIIIFNFDKFLNIFRYENKSVNIESYITQNTKSDDLSKIYEQIKILIEKEKYNSFCLIKFNVTIWKPYSQCQNLDTLKFIRKIIIETRTMDPLLNEDTIQLSKKIHDVGFIYIQKGLLVGEKLLLFLGEDEAFYVQKQINDLIIKNNDLQNQINNHSSEISALKTENYNLKNRVSSLESQVSSLQSQHSSLSNRVDRIDREVSSLDSTVSSLRSDVRSLERRVP